MKGWNRSHLAAGWMICLCLVICGSRLASAIPADARIVDLGGATSTYSALSLGVQGGTLSVIAPGEPQGWNPHASGLDPDSQWFTSLMFGGLVEVDPVTGDPIPWLAKSWEVSASADMITFHLREGLHWSDGIDITAEDVVFTYNEIVLKTDARTALELPSGNYPICNLIDSYTVRFEIVGLMRPLLACLGFDILPKHVLQPLFGPNSPGDLWDINTDPTAIVVSGPWLVASYMPNDHVEFTRNPEYWTYDSGNTQLPYVDTIVARIAVPSNTRRLQFENQDLDFYEPRAQDIAPLLAQPGSSAYTVVTTGDPSYGVQCLMLNQDLGLATGANAAKRDLYRTRYFREAVAELVDEATMISNVYSSLAIDIWSPVPLPSPFFAERASYGGPYTGAGVISYGYDPISAMARLDSLNVVDATGDEIRELDDGDPLVIEILVDSDADRIACAHIIQDSFELAGLNSVVSPVDDDVFLARLNEASADAYLFEIPGLDETHFDANWYSSCGPLRVHRPSACANPMPVDQTIDSLFDTADDTLNVNVSFQNFVNYQQTIAMELELIFLVQPFFQFAYWNDVQNAQLASPLAVRYDMSGRFLELLYLQ